MGSYWGNTFSFIMDELNTEETKEEPKGTLQQAIKEKEELQKLSNEVKEQIAELREMNAHKILGGEVDAGKKEEEKKDEINPKDYAAKVLKGDI